MANHTRHPPTVPIDGEKVRQLREEKGLTQLYVAEVVQVSVDTVSRWENRPSPAVKRENAEALAGALEVDLGELLVAEKRSGEKALEAPASGHRRRRTLPVLAGVLVLAAGAAFLWYATRPPLVVEAFRRLPPYSPPGAEIPVLVRLAVISGEVHRVILRERLPQGWNLVRAVPQPDQGPAPDGTVKWIVPLDAAGAQVAYLARAPEDAVESSAYRFTGEVVTSDRRAKSFPVRGQVRIDLEYVHWADEDADFRVGDAEILDALERLEAAGGLGLHPADLRTLWGREYEWDREGRRFRPL